MSYAVSQMAWDFEFATIFNCLLPSSDSTSTQCRYVYYVFTNQWFSIKCSLCNIFINIKRMSPLQWNQRPSKLTACYWLHQAPSLKPCLHQHFMRQKMTTSPLQPFFIHIQEHPYLHIHRELINLPNNSCDKSVIIFFFFFYFWCFL